MKIKQPLCIKYTPTKTGKTRYLVPYYKFLTEDERTARPLNLIQAFEDALRRAKLVGG